MATVTNIAVLSAPLMALAEAFITSVKLFRFDVGQVQMSQEDITCDPAVAEKLFNVRMRDFESELAIYADQIN